MKKRTSKKKILTMRLPEKSNSDRTRKELTNQPENVNTFANSREKEGSENYNAIQKVLPQQNFTESSSLATKAKTRSTEEKENHHDFQSTSLKDENQSEMNLKETDLEEMTQMTTDLTTATTMTPMTATMMTITSTMSTTEIIEINNCRIRYPS